MTWASSTTGASSTGAPCCSTSGPPGCPTCYGRGTTTSRSRRGRDRHRRHEPETERPRPSSGWRSLAIPTRSTSTIRTACRLDLGVYGAPETFFIDKKGIIRYRHVGGHQPRRLGQTLKPIFDAMK